MSLFSLALPYLNITQLARPKFSLYSAFTLCLTIMLLLVCCPVFAETPIMRIGVISPLETTGMNILRALRSAIFVAFSLLTLNSVKQKDSLAITHFVWLLSIAGLSMLYSNTQRTASTPDFSYFSSLSFAVCCISVIASGEYLRRIMMNNKKSNMYDNLIMMIGTLATVAITIISFKSPIIAADILLSLWSCVIIIYSLVGIYFIINKKIDADITLFAWIPAQIGLIVALGVGTGGSASAIFTSIAAWVTVIIAHGLLAVLCFTKYNHNFTASLMSQQKHQNQDEVCMIVDKPAFRFKADKNRIILNENCARMLYISGKNMEFSLEAFKGLVAPDYHHVVEKIITNSITHPEMIKFHSCKKQGLIHPLAVSSSGNASETLFIYQEDARIEPLANSHNHNSSSSPTSLDNVLFRETGMQDRRHITDLMFFINQIIDYSDFEKHMTGDYILVLFKIRFFDDWQSILGISEASKMVKRITETISAVVSSYDGAITKNFEGDIIGIFAHVLSAEGEIDRLKEMIVKRFENPILVNNQPIFVKFRSGSAKMNVIDYAKTDKTIHITNMIDTAKRAITLIPENNLITPKDLTLPQGANIIQLSSDIRYAPERGQINAYYTPIVDITKGIVAGFNIEPVWRHPDCGIIKDTLLNYLSLRSDMENTLNRLAIAKSIEGMIKLYRSQKMPVMSFEITRHRLLNSTLDEEIKGLCDLLKIDASLIYLEFSPDCLGSDDKWLARVLTDLKAIGVTTILNGFGTAQGQLASLAGLPIDRVIVDSAFADNIVNNERKFFALSSLTKMLSDMAICADIKNVSSLDSLKPLFNAGIKNISGSAVGMAMPAERAVNLLTKNYEFV